MWNYVKSKHFCEYLHFTYIFLPEKIQYPHKLIVITKSIKIITLQRSTNILSFMKKVCQMISRDCIYFLFLRIFRESGGNVFTINTLVTLMK